MAFPKISPAFSRSLLDGHSIIGVIFGAILYIICLSGAVVVLVDQMTMWESPSAPVVHDISPDFVAHIAERSYQSAQQAGADHDIFLSLPSEELPRVTIYAYGEKGQHVEHVASADGQLLPKAETPWVLFLQNLHFNLTVPGVVGRYLVGIFGTILLASIVTGILAHRRIIRDAFVLRWGGARRLANADLHNRVGVWALPFHLIVSLTGSLLGLSGLIIMILALVSFRGDQEKAIAALLGPQATEDSRPAPLPDMRAVLAHIERDAPGARPVQVNFQHVGTMGQQVQVFAAVPGHLTQAEGWTFGGDAQLKKRAGLTDGNIGMRIFGMITPLHYGTYGGLALKLIYVALGTGLTLIVATGGNIWLARRRDQGRAAPRLERTWAALLWGQPAILLATAILSMALPTAPLVPAYWAITLLTIGLPLRFQHADNVVRLYRGAVMALMAIAGAVHWAMVGWGSSEAMIGDALLILCGAGWLVRDKMRFGQPISQTELSAPAA